MFYRNYILNKNDSISLKYKYSDIFIKFSKLRINKTRFLDKMFEKLIKTYENLENHIKLNPLFKDSLTPIEQSSKHEFIRKMIEESKDAETGPMAGVAGAFSNELLLEGLKYANELYIENGGDIALKTNKSIKILTFHSNKKIEKRVGFLITPGYWGIASSSGKMGHSLSFGQADLVTIISKCPIQADIYATSIANMIKGDCEPEEIINRFDFLNAILIIWNDKIWYRGDFEIFFS